MGVESNISEYVKLSVHTGLSLSHSHIHPLTMSVDVYRRGQSRIRSAVIRQQPASQEKLDNDHRHVPRHLPSTVSALSGIVACQSMSCQK